MRSTILFLINFIVYSLIFTCVTHTEEFPQTPEDYQQKLIEYFANVHSTQLVYFSIEQARPIVRQERLDMYNEQELKFRNLLEKRKTNQLTEEETEILSGMSNEEIENKIRTFQIFKKNEPLESLRVFSAKEFQFKIDVKRLSVPDNDFSFQYNGQVGIYNNKATHRYSTAPFITNQWTSYMSFVRFGSGIDLIQKRFPSIVEVNPEKRSIVLNVHLGNRAYPNRVEFIMLDENPFYWKECLHWDREGKNYFRRVVCEDFKDFSNVKVPQVVHQYSKCKVGGVIVDHETLNMTLVDVKINDECDFPKDFFEIKPEWEKLIQTMNRR